jgi:hypothetical protein
MKTSSGPSRVLRHNSAQEATARRVTSGDSLSFRERLAAPQRPNRYAGPGRLA